MSNQHRISVTACADLADRVLIDVRTPGEYGYQHAEGAVNLPLAAITVDQVRQAAGDQERVYIICESGSRAEQAIKKVGAVDGLELVHVTGATQAWVQAGLPVVRGKGAIPIMRQVQIIAGTIIMAGVALGFTVHEYWFGLSGFVGAGLFFAGVSGLCPMATVLGAMPWNKAGGGGSCCSTDSAPA